MKSIEELQSDRSTFSIGEAFSDGWNLVSKHLGFYIAAGIIAVLIGSAAGIIPFIGSLINSLILSPCFMAGVCLFYSSLLFCFDVCYFYHSAQDRALGSILLARGSLRIESGGSQQRRFLIASLCESC